MTKIEFKVQGKGVMIRSFGMFYVNEVDMCAVGEQHGNEVGNVN